MTTYEKVKTAFLFTTTACLVAFLIIYSKKDRYVVNDGHIILDKSTGTVYNNNGGVWQKDKEHPYYIKIH